jgi:hypothetical protein
MTTSGSLKQLPPNPNITQLKNQAKELKRAVGALEPSALDRVHKSHPSYGSDAELNPAAFTLRDAQVTIAREYGFDGWHQLSTHVGEQMIEERDLHRWFGVQLNNRMWEVIEDDGVGPQTPLLERERMLYSAYASAYHWRNVGNEANFARGEHLISRMAARLGEADLALRHARRCLELIEAHPEVMEDWDMPFAYEALARASAAAGDLPAARRHFDRATELTGAVREDADRVIIENELERGPWFGLRDAR